MYTLSFRLLASNVLSDKQCAGSTVTTEHRLLTTPFGLSSLARVRRFSVISVGQQDCSLGSTYVACAQKYILRVFLRLCLGRRSIHRSIRNRFLWR